MLDSTGQRILRAYTWWSVARILLDPQEGISHAKGGQTGTSHYVVPGLPSDHEDGAWHMQTTPKGIALASGWTAAQTAPAHLLRWPDVAAHARALPKPVRTRLADAMREHAEHRRTYRPFAASRYAQGCGRRPFHEYGEEGPRTPQQAAYAAEHEAWLTGHVHPYWDRSNALEAAVGVVLDDALPLATDQPDEPTDLLALLDLLEPA